MKKPIKFLEKKARQDYFTNLMLIHTFEGMGVLVLLTVIYKWMWSLDAVLVSPTVNVLLIISVVASGFLAYLYRFKDNERMLPHLSFTLFLILIFAIMWVGNHSQFGLTCFFIACVVTVVYFIGVYVVIFMLAKRNPKLKQ